MAVKILRSAGRPTKTEELLLLWGQDIATWFEEWQIINGRVATGKSSGGYFVDLTAKNIVYVSNEVDYMPYPLIGRNAGKFPPLGVIEQWIIDKGIPLQDISLSSLAFLIGRKIARKGTDQPRLKEQNITAVINAKSVKWTSRISETFADETAGFIIDKMTKSGIFKEV